MIISLFFYYIFEFIFEILIWGGGGYFVINTLPIKDKHLLIKCSLIFIFYAAYMIFSNQLLDGLNITINNKELIEFIGKQEINNLFKVTAFDFIRAYIQVVIGYVFMDKIIKHKFRDEKGTLIRS